MSLLYSRWTEENKKEQKILPQLINFCSVPIYSCFLGNPTEPNHNPFAPINTIKRQYFKPIYCVYFSEELVKLDYFPNPEGKHVVPDLHQFSMDFLCVNCIGLI